MSRKGARAGAPPCDSYLHQRPMHRLYKSFNVVPDISTWKMSWCKIHQFTDINLEVCIKSENVDETNQKMRPKEAFFDLFHQNFHFFIIFFVMQSATKLLVGITTKSSL